MAEPEQGTYSIISVGSGKAIDVRGGSDKAGENIRQFTYNAKADAQIFSLFVPSKNKGWQVYCSLTGMCMDIESGKVANKSNVRQWSDNNSNAQRFDIETTGGTYTFQGTSYPIYSIKVHGTNFSLTVRNNSNANTENIQLWTYSASNLYHQWILVPRAPLLDEGLYEIIPVGGTNVCFDIESGSSANGANLRLYARNNSNAQKFLVEITEETGLVRFKNYNSGKYIDLRGGTAKNGQNIHQYQGNSSDAQKWGVVQNGYGVVDGISNIPAYEIHSKVGNGFVIDVKNGNKRIASGSDIQLWTRSQSDDYGGQRFIFNKTDRAALTIAPPGSLSFAGQPDSPTTLSRSGAGSISIPLPNATNHLVFSRASQTRFQARYRYRYIDSNRVSGKWSSYYNISDNPATNGQTARSGWGEAWTSSFEVDAKSGDKIVLPLHKYNKVEDSEGNATYTEVPLSFTLNDTNRVSCEIEVEVRSCGENTSNGDHWVSDVALTIIKLVQTPSVSIDVTSGVILTTNSETGELGIEANITTTPKNITERLYARILDSNGVPISELASSSDTTLFYSALDLLHKIPQNEESIILEYTMLTVDGLNISGRTSGVFQYSEPVTPQDIDYSIDYNNDDSCTAIVSAKTYPNLWCMLMLSDIKGNRMVSCDQYSVSNDETKWRIVPPLNQETNLLIIARDSENKWIRFEESVYIFSHLFIWNWTDVGSSEVYNNYASIIVNSETAPKQDRKFTTDEKFNTPAGRVYPVAFSSNNISADLSIEGVVIEEYADYQAFAPLPQHTSINHLRNLIGLSGNGIHPIYRTPYGDWFTVAIENIDLSKSELYYSSARITQRAVED